MTLLAAAPAVVDSTDVEDLVLNDEAPGLTTGGNLVAVKTLTGYLKLDEPTWARRMVRTLRAVRSRRRNPARRRGVGGVVVARVGLRDGVPAGHRGPRGRGRASSSTRRCVPRHLKAGHTKWIRLHRECVLGLLPSRVVGMGTDQDVYAFDRCGTDPKVQRADAVDGAAAVRSQGQRGRAAAV